MLNKILCQKPNPCDCVKNIHYCKPKASASGIIHKRNWITAPLDYQYITDRNVIKVRHCLTLMPYPHDHPHLY